MEAVEKTSDGVACGNTQERDDRGGVRAGHKQVDLDVGSGDVERPRRFEHRDQRVAQIPGRDALHHHHGAGTERAWWLAGFSDRLLGAWICAEQ